MQSKAFFKIVFIALLSLISYPVFGATDTKPTILLVKPYSILVNGKKAQEYRIEQPNGTWGYYGVKGQNFNVIVKNETDQPTVIHWHGLILPNRDDGVPYVTQAPIPPGGQYHYDFKLVQSGTFWMHSHYQFQLQQLMSAPLIIRNPNSKNNNEKNVLMFLTDFSFKSPQTIWKQLRDKMTMKGSQLKNKSKQDLNDVKYDAYLTNYRTLNNPEVVRVLPGEKIRLRVTDAAAASNFFVNLKSLSGKLIAVDAQRIHPITGNTFSVAMGQRLDIEIQIPKGTGAYPILAQGEGSTMQTGLILATPNAVIPKLSENAPHKARAITDQQELSLRALHPLVNKPIDKIITVNLAGNMKKYIWTLNGQVWPKITPIEVKKDQRVEIIFHNFTDMSHPMHLHGHVFEVIGMNGKKFAGANRDTVLVPAKGTVTIIFDANNPGNWMLHCHVLYHEAGGMMTFVNYRGIPFPHYGINFNNSQPDVKTK